MGYTPEKHLKEIRYRITRQRMARRKFELKRWLNDHQWEIVEMVAFVGFVFLVFFLFIPVGHR